MATKAKQTTKTPAKKATKNATKTAAKKTTAAKPKFDLAKAQAASTATVPTTTGAKATGAKIAPAVRVFPSEAKARAYGKTRYPEGNFVVDPNPNGEGFVATEVQRNIKPEDVPAPVKLDSKPAPTRTPPPRTPQQATATTKQPKGAKAPDKPAKAAKATKPGKGTTKRSTTPSAPVERLRESTVANPVKTVWKIADSMRNAKRKDVITKCVAEGVAFYTARTQYQLWKSLAKSGK